MPRLGALARSTMDDLSAFFAAQGHGPSATMLSALAAAVGTMEAMAEGNCRKAIHLSGLDPGVGKTSAVIAFLKNLLRSEMHSEVAALVCLQRLEQIRTVVREAGLSPEHFAVVVADKEVKSLGSMSPNVARVVFTTHAMFERRCGGRSFDGTSTYHYQDRPRQVRIWDEAILPGCPLAVRRLTITSLLEPLSLLYPELVSDLEGLCQDLADLDAGQRHELPDLPVKHDVDLNQVLGALSAPTWRHLQRPAEALWWLLGKTVTIRHEGKIGETVLDYRDTLPVDLAPVLVLDASVRVREVYSEWERGRGGVVRLPEAPKSYANLTLHVWPYAGSKAAFQHPEKQPKLLRGIADTILMRPDEEWLIVHHKSVSSEMERALRRSLPANTFANVRFLNWGRHDATNEFASVPNVILAGTLFYRPSQYEALGRLASGLSSANGEYDQEAVRRVTVGEHRHLILQAASRGAVRRSVGDGCPPAHVYLIAAAGNGIQDALPTIFPGAAVKPWQPVETVLKGKLAEALAVIAKALADDPATIVRFGVVQRATGWKNCGDFRKAVRRHPAFQQRLAELRIGEVRRPSGFALVR